jgi:ketosteroid isomerase-like protein
VLLVAVVALLIGLGLGNAFGTSGRDLRVSEAQLDSRTSDLQAVREELDRAKQSYDRYRVLLSAERKARTRAEEGLEGFARQAARLAGHPVRPVRAGSASRVMGDWAAAQDVGDLQALRATYAPDASVSAVQHGVELLGAEGSRDVARTVRAALPGDLTLTTRVLHAGEFAAAGYAVSGSTGVMVIRVVDGRIAQHWLYLDGGW